MTTSVRPELDLTISRIIKASRSAVWNAWADPASFEQWWVPAPEVCRVRDMDLRPGGSFRTEISQDGDEFTPHIAGCFLAVDELERIVFTDALVAGWRPAETGFMTAVITMRDHPDGAEYIATAMHGCQWPIGTARGRPAELPAGGHENCPLMANRSAHQGLVASAMLRRGRFSSSR